MVFPLTSGVGASDLLLVASFLFYTLVLLLALVRLGRSFGVAPALRTVRVEWPYDKLRHPMYGAYIHLFGLTLIAFPSVRNFWLVILCLFGFFLRAREEEAVLKTDEVYKSVLKVKNRFFGWAFSAPFVAALLSSILFGPRNVNQVRLSFPYSIMTLNPLVYDEWHAVFLGNHIYRRFSDDTDRRILGVSKDVNLACLGKNGRVSSEALGCEQSRLAFNFREFNDCNSRLVSKNELGEELKAVLRKMNWIFPGAKDCNLENFDVCLIGPYVRDLSRRFENIYLRFGWLHDSGHFNAKIGAGPYCMTHYELNKDQSIKAGALEPIDDFKDLPQISFDVSEGKHEFHDLALFGFEGFENDRRKDISSNTPLGYFTISNPTYENTCLPWETETAVAIVQKYLVMTNAIYPDATDLTQLLPSGGQKKCVGREGFTASLSTFMLPDFIFDCEKLAAELNQYFEKINKSYGRLATCGDTTRLIISKVVTGSKEWAGYLSPLSPGYSGRAALSVQYFSNRSAGSWVPGAIVPEKDFRLIGVGKSLVTVDPKVICGIKPQALGLGDLYVTDLNLCSKKGFWASLTKKQ